MIAFAEPEHVDKTGGLFPKNGSSSRPRMKLFEASAKAIQEKANERPIAGTYDAARNGDDYKNIWANIDALDADSAHSPAVRGALVQRSRYEVGNNGYASGIASTYANDLIARGPTLRMQTGSQAFNQMVEREWTRWAKAVKLRRKLWTMAHAKGVDGEAFAVVRNNRRLSHRVKLDVCLYETEQFQTPYLPYGQENYIDGIEFDEFGNPVYYDLLKYHPGANNQVVYDNVPEKIPARFVMHWFKMTRPGQHRQVPESSSTLNIGAASRRWREAVLAASENVANFTMFLKTVLDPDQVDSVSPMSTLDIAKGMLTALPAGYDAFQPRAEQPTANHADFHKSLISEQARPKSMPLNKAACDSSNYNFASGRLDHSTYYGSLDIERDDCNDLVLDPLFDVWFESAVIANGWLGGDPFALSEMASEHTWDWPTHQVADEKSHATATATKLQTGQMTIHESYTSNGKDIDDELLQESQVTGVPVNVLKAAWVLRNLPQHVIQYVAPGVAEALRVPLADITNTGSTPPANEANEETEEEANAEA